MPRSRALTLVAALAIIAGGCDRTPLDPGARSSDVATLLLGAQAARSPAPPFSLPSLVQAALLDVYRSHGSDAVRTMVADMRHLQDAAARVEASGIDREAFRVRDRAVSEEQVGIVLRVFGDDVVVRIMAALADESAGLQRRIESTAAGGIRVAAAEDGLAQARELLADAESAHGNGDARAALRAATDAADRLEAARVAVADALRVPGLDELFDTAVQVAGTAYGPGHDVLATHGRLTALARQQVRTGSRERAQAALAAVRVEEIAVVLRVLGAGPVEQLVQATAEAQSALARDVDAARRSGRDVLRLERMLATSADLLERAGAALDEGNAATALDLGSHAAGLVNALRLALGPE